MTKQQADMANDSQDSPPLVPSKRFTLALLVFFAFIVQYSQRVNLPIAIVCMVNNTKPIDSKISLNGTSETLTETKKVLIEKGGIFEEKQYIWGELKQQILLGGYWAGYIFTQIPGGWLATTIGAKMVYAGSLSISSTATVALTIMYLMESTHFNLMLILRFFIGLAHGVLFPATVALWSLWAVPQERSTLASIGFCGTHLGTSLTMLTGGLLCRYLNAGWMYLFFSSGILGFIWLALWMLFTADSPSSHPRISEHEKNYICNLTGSSGKKRTMSFASIPWKHILMSKPLIALMITHIGNLFGIFFFLTNLGKILNQLLGLPPQKTGYILASGFFLTWLSSFSSGIITDYFVRRKTINLTNARKISNALTSFIPVLCMVSLYFCDQSRQLLGIITVLIYLASSGLGYGSGYVVNFADIVPAYSGVIFGIANSLASAAGLIGNIAAGIIVKQPVLEQWRILYIIFGIVYLISGLVYVLFGSAVPRKWAKFQPEPPKEQEMKLYPEESMPINIKT